MKPLFALLLVLAPIASVADFAANAQRITVVREQQTIRIPLRPVVALPMPRPMSEWKESRGSRCIDRGSIAAATVNGPKSVDFILRDRTRQRARLQNSCPALDYYQGFYLKPTADGKICQDRDAIHSRSGGECEIDRFRKLTPAKQR